MEKYTLHKNKPEVFKCQFQIEGASTADTIVRLCLEFADNKNLFFYGNFNSNGSCEIVIPEMKDIDQTKGKLVIEAIADSLYFKVYEAEVELKNSVDIKLVKAESAVFETANPRVKLKQVSIDQKSTQNIMDEEIQETKIEPSKNPFVPLKTKVSAVKVESQKPIEEKKFRSFNDYLGKTKS